MTITHESTQDGLLEFETWSPKGVKRTICVLNSTKGLTEQQLDSVREALMGIGEQLSDHLPDRVWHRIEPPIRIFTISHESALKKSSGNDGEKSITWDDFEAQLPEIKSSIRNVVAKNYGSVYPDEFGSVHLFDSPTNGNLVSGYLENFGQDACVIGLFMSQDELASATDEVLSTWGHMGVQILPDGPEAPEQTGIVVGVEAAFCMRYPFSPTSVQATAQQEETAYDEISPDNNREDEVELANRIRKILLNEQMIQAIVHEHGGEVAGLRRETGQNREAGENPDLNCCTRIRCRFQDEATRDRVANEVVQSCHAFNVTVEAPEEDWLE